jgi:hypothetical protein
MGPARGPARSDPPPRATAALQHALGQFFNKQRDAVRTVCDLGGDLVGQRLAAGDLLDQDAAILPVEAIERQRRHLLLADPGRLELGSEGDD